MKTFVLLLALVSVTVFFGCTDMVKDNIWDLINQTGNQDKPEETTVVEEEADIIELKTWFFTSGVPNNIIKVKHPNENVIFEYKANNGRFYYATNDGYFVKNLSVPSGGELSWQPSSGKPVNNDFVEIVVKLEESIIGYAVIGIVQQSHVNHDAVVIKSVLFPQIDGKNQNISEDYVKAAIEKVKEEAMNVGHGEPIETELVELSRWNPAFSYNPNSILMKYSDENVLFNCSVDNGYFIKTVSHDASKHVSLRSGDEIFWRPEGVEYAYIEIALEFEKNIVGYAVIEVIRYSPRVLESVVFRKANGEYQNISEEYMKTAIERIKKRNI